MNLFAPLNRRTQHKNGFVPKLGNRGTTLKQTAIPESYYEDDITDIKILILTNELLYTDTQSE